MAWCVFYIQDCKYCKVINLLEKWVGVKYYLTDDRFPQPSILAIDKMLSHITHQQDPQYHQQGHQIQCNSADLLTNFQLLQMHFFVSWKKTKKEAVFANNAELFVQTSFSSLLSAKDLQHRQVYYFYCFQNDDDGRIIFHRAFSNCATTIYLRNTIG